MLKFVWSRRALHGKVCSFSWTICPSSDRVFVIYQTLLTNWDVSRDYTVYIQSWCRMVALIDTLGLNLPTEPSLAPSRHQILRTTCSSFAVSTRLDCLVWNSEFGRQSTSPPQWKKQDVDMRHIPNLQHLVAPFPIDS